MLEVAKHDRRKLAYIAERLRTHPFTAVAPTPMARPRRAQEKGLDFVHVAFRARRATGRRYLSLWMFPDREQRDALVARWGTKYGMTATEHRHG